MRMPERILFDAEFIGNSGFYRSSDTTYCMIAGGTAYGSSAACMYCGTLMHRLKSVLPAISQMNTTGFSL
jgi:hypothetical protein